MRRLLRPLAVLGLSGVVVPFAVGGTVLASFLYLPLPAALPPTKPGASEVSHLLDCIVNDKDVAPLGATFEDGYRCAVVCDAILESARTRRQVDCKY